MRKCGWTDGCPKCKVKFGQRHIEGCELNRDSANADQRGIEGATMTGDQMRAIRKDVARLTIPELASLLRYRDVPALRKMEEGEKPISGPIQLCMEMLRDGRLDPSTELS